MKKIFCAAPFKSIYIDNGENSSEVYAPCCHTGHGYFDGAATYEEYINHPEFLKMKQQFKDGEWPDPCQYCVKSEATGTDDSPRLQHNRYFDYHEYADDDKIEGISLNISNVCNLACGICSSKHSFKKKKEEQYLLSKDIDVHFYKRAIPPESTPDYTRSTLKIDDWLLKTLPNLKGLSLGGGEPFLYNDTDHLTILNTLNLNTVDLLYTTNGTIWPKDKILDELRKVKTLQLAFSVDGVGDQFEYARRLAKWDKFSSTILKWDDFLNEYGHPRPWINAVVSVHTILWIPAVLEWAHARNYEVQHRFLSYPKYMNIHCFPTDIKDKIVDNLDQKRNDITTKVIDEIISWLLKEDSSSLFSTTQKICMESENFTGLNYAKMFPEENSILLLSK